MRSRSPSQSRHRAAYSLLNPGSSALAHTFPLQKGLELGVQQACARGEGRNPWGKALGDDSPALDHPGAYERALTYGMPSESQRLCPGTGASVQT